MALGRVYEQTWSCRHRQHSASRTIATIVKLSHLTTPIAIHHQHSYTATVREIHLSSAPNQTQSRSSRAPASIQPHPTDCNIRAAHYNTPSHAQTTNKHAPKVIAHPSGHQPSRCFVPYQSPWDHRLLTRPQALHHIRRIRSCPRRSALQATPTSQSSLRPSNAESHQQCPSPLSDPHIPCGRPPSHQTNLSHRSSHQTTGDLPVWTR